MPRTPSGSKSSSSKAGTKRRLEFVQVGDDDDKSNRGGGNKKRVSTKQQSAIENYATTNSSFSSPVSKPAEKRSVVTPEKGEEKGSAEFVPKYIHKNVGYHCKGKSEISTTKQAAYELILDSHVIPKDLETSRAFGPLSGTCFEDRVLQAYTLGKLEVQSGYDGDTRICTVCADKGHKRTECPTLI